MSRSSSAAALSECTVVIVQHGEKERRAGDPGLTATGLLQAERAAVLLATMSPTVLVSSPLRRARQTIAPLAARLGLGVTLDARLRERMNLEPEHEPDQFFAAWTRTVQDRSWAPPYGRSSLVTGQDMASVLEDAGKAGGVSVLAGHGGATVDLLRTLLGDTDLETRSPGVITHGIPGGALTTLTRSAQRWNVDDIASVTHLMPTEVTGHRP